MTLDQTIHTLKRDGFINAGQIALAPAEFAELAELVRDAYLRLPADHPDRLEAGLGAEGCRRIPEQHPRIAALLNDVVSTPAIQSILAACLGGRYRIWQVNHRRSSPGDPGLYLHQDAVGEFNLALMLSDNARGEGATMFLAGSHRLLHRMKDLGVMVAPKLFALTGFLFTPLTGHTGDVGFFFNRTWHGRFANRSSGTYDVLLISFFPVRDPGESAAVANGWSSGFLNEMHGTVLGRLIDPPRAGAVGPASESFALAIDDGSSDSSDLRLRASVALLRMLTMVLQPVSRLMHAVTRAGEGGK